MSNTIFHTAPRVTLLGEMAFVESPEHPVNWQGASTDGEKLIEFGGRSCYQSFHNPAEKTNEAYIENILEHRHGSVLAHDTISLYVEGVSRNLTHEQVRHAAGWAYSQLSQRYVDESECAFVIPPLYLDPGYPEDALEAFKVRMELHREAYIEMVDENVAYLRATKPHLDKVTLRKMAREAARSELSGNCETRILLTGNMRAWRHVLEMRASEHADREIRRLYTEHIFPILRARRPNVFQDFAVYEAQDGHLALTNEHRKV